MAAWKLVSYDKIAERPEQWRLDEAAERALRKIRWVVTEKLHGSNFVFVTDGEEIRCAKRRELLAPGEDFFGHRAVLTRLSPAILALFGLAKAALPALKRLSVYGELFGGAYPHPAVPQAPGVSPVQTGIYYSPRVEFCAFDLGAEDSAGFRYLGYDLAMQLFREAGLLYAEPLLTGRLEDALLYPLGFDSTLPQKLGLPPLPGPNKAEGVVVKPLSALTLETARGAFRPVLKRKIPEFMEDERFHQSEKRRAPLSPSPAELLKYEVMALSTAARLKNAISKLGPVRPGEKRRARALFRLFVADVLEQLLEERPELSGLSREERDALEALAATEARRVLKEHFAGQPRHLSRLAAGKPR